MEREVVQLLAVTSGGSVDHAEARRGICLADMMFTPHMASTAWVDESDVVALALAVKLLQRKIHHARSVLCLGEVDEGAEYLGGES